MARDYLEKLKELFETHIRFNAHLGMQINDLALGTATIHIPYQPNWLGDPLRPALHGGLVSTLADTAGGIAVFTQLQPNTGQSFPKVSTVDLRIDYLRHGLPEDLLCTATVLRLGNRVGVTSMVVTQCDGTRVVAEGRGVYNVIRPQETGERS